MTNEPHDKEGDHPMMTRTTPMLIAPECHAAGCHHDGDQYLMVKCRACGHWFCPEHIASNNSQRDIILVDSGLRGLSYYLGRCVACQQSEQQAPVRQRVDSSWLR
jgi:hypothetical protein